jgi:hypothetical protein
MESNFVFSKRVTRFKLNYGHFSFMAIGRVIWKLIFLDQSQLKANVIMLSYLGCATLG